MAAQNHQDIKDDLEDTSECLPDNIDLLACLVDRGLLHITDKILFKLGAASLLALKLVSHLHMDLVINSRHAMEKVRIELAWIEKKPRVRLVSDNPGHMITCMATDDNTIIYGLLGQDATVNIHNKEDLKLTAKLVQEHNFPASISSMDCNSTTLVTCAYEAHTRDGMQYAVHIWNRKEKIMTSRFRPHTDLIRGVKLCGDHLVVTASNDGTIAVTSIEDPWHPKLVERLIGHTDIICSVDVDGHWVASVSTDSELRVWSLTTMSCTLVLLTKSPSLRVALKWPLAATGGQSSVLLWDLAQERCIRVLAGPNHGILNVLAMDTLHLVMGDHMGRLSIWSLNTLTEGHVGKKPHRIIDVSSCDQGEQTTGQELMSALKVEKNTIITGGWAGKCICWDFSH
eukprot:GFUD01039937.1.p1 GENE.GFUD01039937.1~~GFUD01039937.1.p1  ORF type:complete len:399 (-),score=95.54 GFUD01039937.1:114-1310(-)